jgi:pimeloyl-ACP methyl ester carboxylesterase
MVRRDFITATAAMAAAGVLGGGVAAQGGKPAVGEVERSATRIKGFDSGELDFQLMRSLSAGDYGGATAGEVFSARTQITGDSPAKWPDAFGAMGKRVEGWGDAALAKNRRISARDHFLRASMYYRAAEYFTDVYSPQAQVLGLASRNAFLKAAPLLADRVEAIEVPFEGYKLPGYFMAPAGGAVRGRTIVVLTGFDGTGEELYFEAAAAGLERGYNVFIAEGPGQTGCRRFNPDLVFRPDYEVPIAAILDAAIKQDNVAPERLALYGISFGGYFVTRAGEHDRRIKALIANSPIVDLFRYMAGFIGPQMIANPPPVTLAEVDQIPDAEFPLTMKLSFKAACRRFGVDNFAAWIARLKEFTAVDRLAEIRCPSLAMVGVGEGQEALSQSDRFVKGVSGPVTQRIFTTEEGADMHCQLGNLRLSCAAVYDWLDEVFGA